MSQHVRVSVEWVGEEMQRADNLIEEQKWAQAIATLEGLVVTLRKAGWGHASVLWRLAMVHDMGEALEQAYRLIADARLADPASPGIRSSYGSITRRFREAIASGEAAGMRRGYELLRSSGETDAPCHVAMARHHFVEGEPLEAEVLLSAVATLHPAVQEAWELRAEVAAALGDEELASTCRFMASAAEEPELLPTQSVASA